MIGGAVVDWMSPRAQCGDQAVLSARGEDEEDRKSRLVGLRRLGDRLGAGGRSCRLGLVEVGGHGVGIGKYSGDMEERRKMV